MGGLAAGLWITGAIGCALYYWFTRGRNEEFIVGRVKTVALFWGWPIFLIVLFVNRGKTSARQPDIDETKRRILG